MKKSNSTAALAMALVLTAATAQGQAKPETRAAFETYVQLAEERIAAEQASTGGFLHLDSVSASERTAMKLRLSRGEVVVEKLGSTPKEAPGGLIHDWRGTAFLPGATVERVLATVQDYDHLARYYAPEVMHSQLVSRSGNDFHIRMRLREHKVVTVVLDTEYDVHYGRQDNKHWFSQSRSTRVQEIADPGTAAEHAGADHGFLWRLNTYWRFVQADEGVYVQCEAISLTRDIPTGLGWLVRPFIENIPRESLGFTMRATAQAVAEQAKQAGAEIAQHPKEHL